MSTSSYIPRKKLCRFYRRGCCINSENCRFSHESTDKRSDSLIHQSESFINSNNIRLVQPGTSNNLDSKCQDFVGNHKSENICNQNEEELKRKQNQEYVRQKQDKDSAIARSKGKTCSICFEIVKNKPKGEQRFGILPNCNHCFCLSCIRQWRQERQFENNIIRACPECRITSDFVCPSTYWVDIKEDKEKLIVDYKNALSKKDCKYFNKGHGKCPFGNKCFYLHKDSNGLICDVGPPSRQRRRKPEIEILESISLWDILDENPWFSFTDEFEDLMEFLSDSEDSLWTATF